MVPEAAAVPLAVQAVGGAAIQGAVLVVVDQVVAQGAAVIPAAVAVREAEVQGAAVIRAVVDIITMDSHPAIPGRIREVK